MMTYTEKVDGSNFELESLIPNMVWIHIDLSKRTERPNRKPNVLVVPQEQINYNSNRIDEFLTMLTNNGVAREVFV